MTNTAIEVNTSKMRELFDLLNPEQFRSASRSAFNKAGRTILNAVKANYQSMFPGSILYKDIHMKAFRSGKGVMIDLLYTKGHSKGDPLYKSYVMKILELGSYKTGNRETAKAYSRGTLGARQFFRPAVDSVKSTVESDLRAMLQQAMQKQVEKAAKR